MSTTLTAAKHDEQSAESAAFQTYWLWAMCLLGVDYFSTLAYQPSLTFQAAGWLAPLATVIVVLATLLGALPIYWYIAGKSPFGQGSIALMEQLVQGWRGKTLVLLLLGFAATDFVMIKTISLADAAEHLIHNTYVAQDRPLRQLAQHSRQLCREYLGAEAAAFFTEQLMVTILLSAVGFFFWYLLRQGFNRNVIRLAVPLVALYLVLNGLVIGCGVAYLVQHPQRLADWWAHLQAGQWHPQPMDGAGASWLWLILLCLFFLPQLSLGLSGFELSLLLMPQIRGKSSDDPQRPRGRIRNTRKMLTLAAFIMSFYLLGSALVTTIFIPPAALLPGGLADNRALAYLAHGGALAGDSGPATLSPLFGPLFGTLYDICTILLLGLAGTSVMMSLAALLPGFLLRFGMEFHWVHRWGLLLTLFYGVNLLITVYFRASVHDQRGAYATSVLVLVTSAALTACLSRQQKRPGRLWRGLPWKFTPTAVLFSLTTLAVMLLSPTGLLISFCFIVALLTTSVFARAVRSDELRTIGFDFASEQARFLWDSLRMADVPVLVPHRPGRQQRENKEKSLRADHNLTADVDIVFLEVEVDDPSNFYQKLLIDVFRDERRIVVKVTRCTSVAHAIASIALEISRVSSKPPAVHFGWTEMDMLAASWSYLAFGEGNIPWKVHELIQAAEPDSSRQPRVVIG